mgnify:FL=1
MAGTFGTIDNPFPDTGYGSVGSGLPLFITNSIKLIFIAGGLWAFFNLMFAGFTYITAAGDEKKIQAATTSINMSLLGLVIMVAAAAITGIISYILFGDAAYILKPNITGPGTIESAPGGLPNQFQIRK